MKPRLREGITALALAGALVSSPSCAEEFGLYLFCKGTVVAEGRSIDAHLDVSLLRDSSLALVGRSNVLPGGERMKLEISPAYYSMVLRVPHRHSAIWYDLIRGTVFVWAPDLQRLNVTRISVDRQTGALEGDMVDAKNVHVGRLEMACDSKDNISIPKPKV